MVRPRKTRPLRERPNPILAAGVNEVDTLRRSAKRSFAHALQASRARDLLRDLPAAGESVHGVQRGNFNFWDIVPAVLELQGEPAKRLTIATLGFSRENLDALLELLDSGAVAAASLVASVFHQAHNQADCAFARAELAARGSAFKATRSHAKVICLDFQKDAYTLEGSANLRSCRMVEQFCISNDRELLDFHCGWIGELADEKHHAEEAEADPDQP